MLLASYAASRFLRAFRTYGSPTQSWAGAGRIGFGFGLLSNTRALVTPVGACLQEQQQQLGHALGFQHVGELAAPCSFRLDEGQVQ